MEMLNLNTILASDLWTILISAFSKVIVNYGWTIILFTIALKLVLSPLDIFQRISSQKQSKHMSAMQPELNALQAKYGNNKEKLNQEQAKLYKKYNINVGGMCLSMFIPLLVTLIVFGTLYGSLRSFGEDKLYESYAKLDATYQAAVVEADNIFDITTQKTEYDQYIYDEVANVYEVQQEQNSWLWVKNVWKGDTKVSQMVDFDDYAKYKKLKGEDKEAAKVRYDEISEIVETENPGQNGYFILLILAGAISFLTQLLSTKLLTPKGQKLNTMNKVMMAIIPITMIIFASTSNTAFTLYIITNSLVTAIISTIIALIMKRKGKGNNDDIVLSKKSVEVVEYSRNYKK